MGDLLRRRALMIAPGGDEQWAPTDDHIYSSYYIRDGNYVVRSGDVFTFKTNANSWNSYITAQPALYKVKDLSGRFRLRGHLVCASGARLFVSMVNFTSTNPRNQRTSWVDVGIVEDTSGGYSGDLNVEFTIDMSNWAQENYVTVRWWVYSSTAIADAAVLTAPVMEAILL